MKCLMTAIETARLLQLASGLLICVSFVGCGGSGAGSDLDSTHEEQELTTQRDACDRFTVQGSDYESMLQSAAAQCRGQVAEQQTPTTYHHYPCVTSLTAKPTSARISAAHRIDRERRLQADRFTSHQALPA